MSLIQSSVLRPATKKFSFIFDKPKLSLFHNNYSTKKKNYYNSRIRNNINIGRTDNNAAGYRNIPCRLLHHPLEAELPLMEDDQITGSHGDATAGIGIQGFFQGKNIFVTGATGLVGKAFIEKLLRSTSVGKIFVLMKAKNKEEAHDRLTKEIIQSELFESVREKYGSLYEEFMKEKLIPIVGNICEPNLGMDLNSANAILNDVNVIVQSAASTTLQDRYDYLIDMNVNAPQRLMRLAKACRNLQLFVHVSTAYVNGRKEGVIFEKPLIMGDNGRKEEDDDEVSLFPRLDVADEINLAMAIKSSKASSDCDVTRDLKRLGLERAAFYGWYNTYHMTKAMAEMVLNEIKEDVPLLVIRPTVIESTYREPTPGWIQGNRMFDPVIIAYGKGQLPAYLGDPQTHMDIVPLDLVVNTTIAAIAKHGNNPKPQSNVYTVATNFVNPLRFSKFFEYIHEYFMMNSFDNSSKMDNIPEMRFFNEFCDFSKFVRDEISHHQKKGTSGSYYNELMLVNQKQYKARVAYAEQLCKMYEFIGFIKARFHTGNTRKLLEEMSKEEQLGFEVDATKIDWRKYFVEIHIPGLRKHVLNGTRITA